MGAGRPLWAASSANTGLDVRDLDERIEGERSEVPEIFRDAGDRVPPRGTRRFERIAEGV